MKRLTREQEIEKMKAWDIISDITSVRNPHRMEDIGKIISIFQKRQDEIARVK